MATDQSPDGQQTQQQQPPAGSPAQGTPAGGDPIRNWDEVRKIIHDRDELKSEVRDLRAMVEGLGEKLTTLVKPPADAGKPDGQSSAPKSPLEEQLEQIASKVNALASKDEHAAKSERRRAITDAVISQASEGSRELVRGALATLAIDGAIDLYAERTQDEVDKALAKLRASHPGAFASSTNGMPAPGAKHNIIPEGVALHELTAEQLARLSDEDFSKMRKAARTSGLAV